MQGRSRRAPGELANAINWRWRALAPSSASVAVEHYLAGASEVFDLETTGPILSLYLKMPAKLEALSYPGDLYSFIRVFKRANGLTPHQYLIETRLQAARDLIERGQRDVTEAALNCGFSTMSHFSVAFRKRWRIPPSALKPRSMISMREEVRESIDR
ncbi:helix-turn-helix transcriptional regulator [Paraburkholderia diazotrophica]|uniref:helix-turn-helix transcriptional regulator n=1 Tax=Paraburkholderia diazotrophica TaxID=667676 RepID=UPI00317B2800